MTKFELIEESIAVLPEYGRISIAFKVQSVLQIEFIDSGLRGFHLTEKSIEPAWIKDYDAYPGQKPEQWAKQWDISNWQVISAFIKGSRIGGCVIAFNTPGVDMLEGRSDIAVLWDLRVGPEYRQQGLGSRLVEAAIAWAKNRHCLLLKIETQNINVPACRLYAKLGFTLSAVNRRAYPELPDEVQLIWIKEL